MHFIDPREGFMGAGRASDPADHEGLYPIRTVSALTGVNPVTLRAWERRYGLIRPKRTAKGHRLYTEADIERINRVLELLDQGISIGQARRLLESRTPETGPAIRMEGEDLWAGLRRRAAEAIHRFDESLLETVYSEALSTQPASRVQRQLALPLSRELADRSVGSDLGLAEWAFFNAFMRTKLGAQLHHHGERGRGPKLLAAGLPGETGEIELLLFCLAALGQGYRIALLGGGGPLEPLAAASDRAGARALVLFGEGSGGDRVLDGIGELVTACDIPVLVGGRIAEHHEDRLADLGATALPEDSGEALGHLYETLAR